MSYITPQTPPRARQQARPATPKGLSTPTTPYKSKGSGLMTPSTSTKKLADPFSSEAPGISSHSESVFKTPSSILKKPILNFSKQTTSARPSSTDVSSTLLTPEFTPQRSPNRSARKRKVFPDDIFKHATNSISKVNDKLSFGLLLPMPSTVGSGRKAPAPVKAGRSSGSPINDSLIAHDHIDIEQEEIDLETPMLKEPITPSKQLIDDDLVSHWHGKSFNNYSSDEDLSDEEIVPAKPVNPFIEETKTVPTAPKKRVSNPFSDPFNSPTAEKQTINYDTHMELIKSRTGEKRVVKLTSRQSQIKPKKLDFSNI